MVIKMNKPVSKIIKELKQSVDYNYSFFEDFITLDVDAEKVLQYMANNLPELSIQHNDVKIFGRNLKILFDDRQWLLLRLSGTEPAFRLFAEFKDADIAKKLIEELKQYIDKVQNIVSEK